MPQSIIGSVSQSPLEIHKATVKPEWIDYNGHLNMAYYVLMFDNATDNFFDLIDLGMNYANHSHNSAFVLETHVTYQREVSQDDPLRFTLQLIDADQKRLHYYLEMFHAEQGFRASTSEQIAMHVDLSKRKSRPFPKFIKQQIDLLLLAHAELPRPDNVGRSVGLRPRT